MSKQIYFEREPVKMKSRLVFLFLLLDVIRIAQEVFTALIFSTIRISSGNVLSLSLLYNRVY